jgi:hypothetical protein
MTYGDTVVIDGEVSLLNQIDGELSLNAEYEGEIGDVIVVAEHDLPTYTGPTVINPDFVGTSLPTKNKVLAQNITIKPIEVQTVSNLAGGKTVYIGGII